MYKRNLNNGRISFYGWFYARNSAAPRVWLHSMR